LNTGRATDLLHDGANDAQDFEHGWGNDHDIGDFLEHLADSDAADDAVLGAMAITGFLTQGLHRALDM